MKEIRYYYRIERITHRPTAEDKLTVIQEIKEKDLQLARLKATSRYLDELLELKGKYSPESFKSYDIKKGLGFNYQLLLIDGIEENVYVVESTMQDIKSTISAQRNQEEGIFQSLGLDLTHLKQFRNLKN